MLDRCCVLALLRVDTRMLQALWNDLRFLLVGLAFQEEKASYFKATASTRDSKPWVARRVGLLKMRI